MRSIKLIGLVLALCTSLLFSNSHASPPGLPLGTTGKIAGKVTDAKTGSPLGGAIIKVDGTTMGAEADAAGDYVILNVPVGTYSVTCSYVGYETLKQTEVKVSADVTTTLNFTLSEQTIITGEIEVISKRNVLSPDQSGKIITEESIVNTGIRGIENIAAKTAGVVQDERGTQINIRGGRTNETAVIIDGVLTTNPLDGNSTAYVSNSLLQELSVLTGGFSAEYGNVLSGIINVTTKSGSDKYSGTIEVLSDGIYSKMLNTFGSQYNIYNAAVGGPLIPTKKLRKFINFYVGGERNYFGVNNPSWVTRELPFEGQSIPDFLWVRDSSKTRQIGYKESSTVDRLIPGYSLKRWSGNGKINVDFSALNKKLALKVIGGANVSRTNSRLFIQSYMLYNSRKNPLLTDENNQFYGKVTHQPTPKIFYEVQFNYFDIKHRQEDPDHLDNLFRYGDPVYNNIRNPGERVGSDPYGLFFLQGRVNNFFTKSQTQYYEGSFSAVAQLKKNEIKIGGNYRYHTIRLFEINPTFLAQLAYQYPGIQNNRDSLKIFVDNQVGTNYFGYNFLGDANDDSKLSDGYPDGARHPIIASAYLQDKIEFKDFTINAGLRFDYLDPNSWRVKDIENVTSFGDPQSFGIEDIEFKSDPTYAFSPRLGFSFPVTENTIFHAQYGRFIQMPQLEFLYNGFTNMKYWINIGGFAGTFGNPNLKPEKTTSYEIGFKQNLGNKLSFDITAFYKETEDLIGIKKYPQLPSAIQVYANQDYGTIRGLDVSADFRRTYGFAFTVAYSLSYASGTGSDPNSSSIAHWLGGDLPKLTSPLDYDQRHTGTINIDFRLSKDNLPNKGVWAAVLNRLGINLLYSFNSGRPYTKKDPSVNPLLSTGSGAATKSGINAAYGPWNHRLDLKIDKTVTIWKLDLNLYAWVINVLDYRLVNGVWDGSGDPGEPGFLSTQLGQEYARSFDLDTSPSTSTADFTTLYNYATRLISNYGPPRQIRFGARLSF